MGIYIKGMEMPKSCANCPLRAYDRDDQKFCGITGNGIKFGLERPKDCPLVSVPPHGRLIDADAYMRRHAGGEMLKFASTIIQKDEVV